MRLVLAARRSDLARIQAFLVGKALQQAHPKLTIHYSFHDSLGDRNQNDPLWQMPEKGVFTEDLREGLLNGRYDLAVHSWKDLAIETDSNTSIAATLPRADPRDVLLIRRDRWEHISQTGRVTILTSSPRRSYNLDSCLRRLLPFPVTELTFTPVRGNVPTRVRKLCESGTDGLVVAKAALDRLLETEDQTFEPTKLELRANLNGCNWMVLPLRVNPAAPGQGALAVEVKRDRTDLRRLLSAINCSETFETVTQEREILRHFGGGCHQKIGVSIVRRPYGEITYLRGLTDDERILDSQTLKPSQEPPGKVPSQEMWPLKASAADWFTRTRIARTVPEKPLWVSKADALPPNTRVALSQFVWASGLKTWEKLAQRGVWVNGCAESLGEQEDPHINTLVGWEVNWVKLTHSDGAANHGSESVATYSLVPNDYCPDLRDKKYFYWTSGSAFERALSLNPWIAEMTHFCGPGNTERTLRRKGIKAFVFLDHEQWLKEMSLT